MFFRISAPSTRGEVMRYTAEQLAMVVHEANRGLQMAQEDTCPSPPWFSAPAEMKMSTIVAVKRVREGMGPAGLHQAWMDDKKQLGWVHGPHKDDVRKTHPCMIEWGDLPAGQRDKDRLFVTIVRMLSVEMMT